jgi:hypothetical protein
MARRKELIGIANGILGSFKSRNNELDGYWSIGVLENFISAQNIWKLTDLY